MGEGTPSMMNADDMRTASAYELADHATRFEFPIDTSPDGYLSVKIEKRSEGKWCVIFLSQVLNREGEWEYEPLPSGRDDDFIARTRFTLKEAVDRVDDAVAALQKQHNIPLSQRIEIR